MKPLGVTPFLGIVHPTRAQDAIWEAVEKAIAENMTPEKFRAEVALAWAHEFKGAAKYAADILMGRIK